MPAQLVDTYIFKYEKPFLVESGDGSKRLKVRGRFQMADEINDNNRKYPLSIWQKRLSENSPVMRRVNNRSMLGTLEHPEDGQTRLGDASHVITKLELAPNGEVIGEAEVLDTSLGRELRALFEAQVTVGISSRGTGTVTEKNGVYEVNDDYNLETFDFVHNNSVAKATPKPVTESKEKSIMSTSTETAPKKERRLNEMRQADLRIGKLNQIDVTKLDLAQRAEMQSSIIEERCTIDEIIHEDASLSTYGRKLQTKLDTIEATLTAEPKAEEKTSNPADDKAPTPEKVMEAYKRLCSALIERCKTQKMVLEEAESKAHDENDSPEDSLEEQNAEVVQELVKRYKALEKITEEVLSRTRPIRAKAALFERRFNVSVELIEALVEKYKEDIGSSPLTESRKSGKPADPLPSDRKGATNAPVKSSGSSSFPTILGSASSAVSLLERARLRRTPQTKQ